MNFDVLIMNRKNNRQVLFTAESFEYNRDTGFLKIWHDELGHVSTRISADETIVISTILEDEGK